MRLTWRYGSLSFIPSLDIFKLDTDLAKGRGQAFGGVNDEECGSGKGRFYLLDCAVAVALYAAFLVVDLFPTTNFLTSNSSGFFISEAMAGEVIPPSPSSDGSSAFDIFSDTDAMFWWPIKTINERHKQKELGPELMEVFTGVDGTENQVGFYSGGVTSVFGPYLGLKGFKLRAVYGKGYYQYRSNRDVGGKREEVKFTGVSNFYEAMAGYEFRQFGSIFKAYTGIVSERNSIDPRDVENKLEGEKLGAKLLLEVWRNLDDERWFSGYGSFTTGSEYYTVHGRYGMPLNSYVDFGIEAGAFGNKEFDAVRVGGFSRIKLGAGELTFSAGVSGDYEQPDALYGTLQYFTKIHGNWRQYFGPDDE